MLLLTSFLTHLLTYLLTCLLTYSVGQIPAWDASRFSASQEIPRIVWNTKVRYYNHKFPLPVHILGQLDPVHTPHPTSWRSILILSSHLCLGLPSGLILQVSPPWPHIIPSSLPLYYIEYKRSVTVNTTLQYFSSVLHVSAQRAIIGHYFARILSYLTCEQHRTSATVNVNRQYLRKHTRINALYTLM